jgi:YD repeat-containing protein
MKSRRFVIRCLFAIILVISVTFGLNPAIVSAYQLNSYAWLSRDLDRPDLIDFATAKEKGHIRRVLAREDEYTFIFENSDGSQTSYSYQTPVQTRDQFGKLHAIDLDISSQRSANGQVSSYTVTGDGYQITLPKQLSSDQPIQISHVQYPMTLAPVSSTDKPIQSSEGQLKKVKDYYGTIEYKNAFGANTSLELSTTLTGYKEDIILTKAPTNNVFSYQITAPDLTGTVLADGAVQFHAISDLALVYTIPAPFAIDSYKGSRIEGDGHYTEEVAVSLELQADGSWLYSLTVDENFLYSKNTVYPVRIDPPLLINTCPEHKDTYIAEGTPTTLYYNGDKMFVGKDSSLLVCRGFVNFDFTRLWAVDAQSITDAYYNTEEFLGYTSTCYVRVFNVTGSWTSPTLKWSNKPNVDTSTIIDSKLVNGARAYSFNVTSLVQGWHKNQYGITGGIAQNGFTLMSDREGSIVLRKFRSSEASVNPPVLVINYSAVDRVAPNPPGGLTASYSKHSSFNGTASLNISWTAASDLPSPGGSGIKNYEVVVKNAAGVPVASNYNVTGTSINTGFLSDNTTYTVYVKAVDNAYDRGDIPIFNASANATISIAIPDCQQPVINSLTVDPSGWTNAASVQLGWQVNEPSGLNKLEYWLNGSSITTLTAPTQSGTTQVSTSTLASGTHTLNARFTDNQGNITTDSRILYIDKSTPGTFSIIIADPGETTTDLTWTAATDNVGVAGYNIYANNTLIATTAGTGYTVTGLKPDTEYVLTVKAFDTVGNQTEPGYSVNVRTKSRLGRPLLHETAEISILGGDAFADLVSGNLSYRSDDLALPGWPLSLSISRNYNSRSDFNSGLGFGWAFGLDIRLIEEFPIENPSIPRQITFRDHNGTNWGFAVESENGVVTGYSQPFGCPYALARINGLYQLTDSLGLIYNFNSNLQLATVHEQPSIVEQKETVNSTDRLLSVSLNSFEIWVFNAEYDTNGSFTGLVAEDASCPFTLALVNGQYVLSEKVNSSMTYSFETNTASNFGECLEMTTAVTAGSAVKMVRVSFGYDANQRLSTIGDELGHSLTVTYNGSSGKVDSIYRDSLLLLKYHFNIAGQLVQVDRIHGIASPYSTASTIYSYDANGYLRGIEDPDNVRESLTFDSIGRLTGLSSLYSFRTVTATDLDIFGRKLTHIVYGSAATTVKRQFQFSEQATNATSETITTAVDLGQTVYSINTTTGLITNTAVYSQPVNPNYVGDSPIRTIVRTWLDDDLDGNLDRYTWVTDDNDSSTPNLSGEEQIMAAEPLFYAQYQLSEDDITTLYDPAGRVIANCEDPANHGQTGHLCQQYLYTPAGRIYSESNKFGQITSYLIDLTGQVIKTTHADGHESIRRRDFIVEPGFVFSAEYLESLGIPNGTNYFGEPEVSFTNDFFLQVEIDYGLNYFVEQHLDTLGQKVYEEIRNCGDWLYLVNSYNGLGQLKTQTNRAGDVTSFDYNANGDVTKETVDPVTGFNLETNRSYTSDFKLEVETDPHGTVTSYSYEPIGENSLRRLLTKSVLANGVLTIEAYNYSNLASLHYYELTTTRYNGATTGTGANSVTVARFDEQDRATLVSQTVEGLYASQTGISNSFSYNEDNQLATIGHNGFSYVFSYDEDGQVDGISVSDGTNSIVLLSKTTTENSDGSKTSADAYANGQTVTSSTDANGRTTGIQLTQGGNTTTVYSFSYGNEGSSYTGQNKTTVIDNSSSRKTVSIKSDDANSFNQTITVYDLASLNGLYNLQIANSEQAITLQTQIGGTSQSYEYSKDDQYRLYKTEYELPGQLDCD